MSKHELTAVLIVPTSFSCFLEPLLTLTVNTKALSHIHFNYWINIYRFTCWFLKQCIYTSIYRLIYKIFYLTVLSTRHLHTCNIMFLHKTAAENKLSLWRSMFVLLMTVFCLRYQDGITDLSIMWNYCQCFCLCFHNISHFFIMYQSITILYVIVYSVI